jgi:predicted nucleotidyltransferase
MVALNEIESFSRELAREFRPKRIVLFGSHATGRAGADSDVDLLVSMEHEGCGAHVAAEIIRRLRPRFSVDLVIRSEDEIRERLRMHDFFLAEILREGRVLHESAD